MSGVGLVHFLAGWLALGSGGVNLVLRKGTRGHRALGYLFVFSMVLMNLVALSLYNLTGHVNMFHALAVVSLVATAAAMLPLARRRPGWLVQHARRMQWAYIGLCAAAANEILTREVLARIPATMHGFWALSAAVSGLVIGLGGWLGRRQRAQAGWGGAAAS